MMGGTGGAGGARLPQVRAYESRSIIQQGAWASGQVSLRQQHLHHQQPGECERGWRAQG